MAADDDTCGPTTAERPSNDPALRLTVFEGNNRFWRSLANGSLCTVPLPVDDGPPVVLPAGDCCGGGMNILSTLSRVSAVTEDDDLFVVTKTISLSDCSNSSSSPVSARIVIILCLSEVGCV